MPLLIDGKWIKSKKEFEIRNPYNNEIVGKAPIASKEEINKALSLAYKRDSDLSPEQRADILKNTAKDLKKNKKDFSELITSESGLCIKQTLHEVDRSLNVLLESAKVAQTIEEDMIERFTPDKGSGPKLRVISDPLKLAVAITPFNHPLNQVTHKVCPAIAADTSMVLKPSEKTPLSAFKFGQMLMDNGLPKNMLNIVTGSPPKYIVDELITHPQVEMVTFTGGVEVGKYIANTMGKNNKEFTKKVLELGGNSACTVLEDADIDLASKVCLDGSFGNSGQRCTAIKRILLHNEIADQFIDRFMGLTENFKYGDPMDPGVDMGTVIDEKAAIEIQDRVRKSIKQGAKLLYGDIREGALYSPTILDKVNPGAELVKKETFGPVAPIIRVNDVDEAIKIINSTQFKLAGSSITKNKKYAEKIAAETQVGQFNWNGPPGYRTEQAPFGGYGLSGNYEKEGVIMAAESMRRIRTFYSH